MKTRQYRNDRAATFRSRGRFARAGSLANLGFAANIPLAPVVSGFDVWVLHENVQFKLRSEELVLTK